MLLIEYEYYSDTYKGSSIPETSFSKIAIEVSSKVNYYTFNRITADVIDDTIRNACCEIAELIYSQNLLKAKLLENDTDIKASETVGSHSVSYVNKTSIQSSNLLTNQQLEQECYRICLRYLGQTGLMFRGAN